MFDRNGRNEGPVAVEITLQSGQELRGKFLLSPGRALPETLNGPTNFMDFEPFGGHRTFIAKSSIAAVRPMEVDASPSLSVGGNASNFDPFVVLGVAQTATNEEVRARYLKLAKIYHPDRYAAAELPSEVREYLAAMVRRVNAAFDAVENLRRKQAAKQEPVFSTSGRS
jgi:hypothetical protein